MPQVRIVLAAVLYRHRTFGPPAARVGNGADRRLVLVPVLRWAIAVHSVPADQPRRAACGCGQLAAGVIVLVFVDLAVMRLPPLIAAAAALLVRWP